MARNPGWKKLISSGSVGRSLSLDGLRRKLTKGLEVRVEHPAARRGDALQAVVVITDPEGLGDLEVGIVCTESYDEVVNDSDGGTSRTTSTAIEHEAWQPLASVPGEHDVTLSVPHGAPYSYEGDCLSFRWEVVARGRKSRALDARASEPIMVRP